MRRSLLLLALSLPVAAQSITRDGYLTDPGKAIDAASAGQLQSVLAGIEGRTGFDLAIVVVKKADGGAGKLADDLFRKWDKGNLGLVFVLAVEQGDYTFSMAPPLRKVFTGKYCDDLSARCFSGPFSDGHYGEGILKAFEDFAEKIPRYEAPTTDAQWYAFSVDGRHVGYKGESCQQKPQGFTTVMEALVQEADGKQVLRHTEFVESADGTPLQVTQAVYEDKELKTETRGEVSKGELLLTVTAGDKEEKRKLSMAGDPIFPHAIRERARTSGLKTGTKWSYSALNTTLTAVVAVDAEVVGVESIEADGTKVEAAHVRETADGKTTDLWLDARGVPLRQESAAAKGVLVRCTHDKATEGFLPEKK